MFYLKQMSKIEILAIIMFSGFKILYVSRVNFLKKKIPLNSIFLFLVQSHYISEMTKAECPGPPQGWWVLPPGASADPVGIE